MPHFNTHQQPIGNPLPGWQPRRFPLHRVWEGIHCILEPICPVRHTDDLYAAYEPSAGSGDWTYLPAEPPALRTDFDAYVRVLAASADPQHYAIISRSSGKATGTIALTRIDTANGTAEIGYVQYSRALRRTSAATEAPFLLISYLFEQLGYRRIEWKCDSLNAPSRHAALRLGFTFEGTFRSSRVYKGRNRDTDWFALIDSDWPPLQSRFLRWLSPENFDASGQQIKTLTTI